MFCMVELESAVFNCYISIINYCYVIFNNIWRDYESRMTRDDFGRFQKKSDFAVFDPAELQSLVRVASLICKDRYEPPIREGLTCLRVSLSFSPHDRNRHFSETTECNGSTLPTGPRCFNSSSSPR